MNIVSTHIRAIASTLDSARPLSSATLPSHRKARCFVVGLMERLFPALVMAEAASHQNTALGLAHLAVELEDLLIPLEQRIPSPINQLVDDFFETLPALQLAMLGDADAIFRGDPAAESLDEVIVAYPGFLAIAIQRIAHEFYKRKVPVFPRMLTELAHQMTGVDIHPGAEIGCNFFIDHATGIVIGETAQIGNNVKIYQGVTLGALSVDKCFAGKKRHPTIEDNVIIYSNATILGGDTVIGHDSIIGGNVWLTASVPPGSTVYQKTEVHVKNSRPEGEKE